MAKNERLRFRLHVSSFFRGITVEPIVALYMLAFMMISIVEQDFFFIKICTVDLRVNENLCHRVLDESKIRVNEPNDDGGESNEVATESGVATNFNIVKPTLCHNCTTRATLFEIKLETQSILTSFLEINSIVGNVISLLVAFVIAHYSDRCSRKFLLVVGLSGKIVYTFGLLIVSLVPRFNAQLVTILATLPSSFFGGDSIIFASAFAYVTDLTTERNRSKRILLLDLSYLVAMPIGLNLGSFLFYRAYDRSYSSIFLTNIALTLVALLYTLLRLKSGDAESIVSSTSSTLDSQSIASTKLMNIRGKRLAESGENEECSDDDLSRIAVQSNTNENGSQQHHYIVEEHRVGTSQASLNRLLFLSETPSERRDCRSVLLLLAAAAFYAFHRSEKNVTYMYTQVYFGWNLGRFTTYKSVYSISFLTCMLVTSLLVKRCSTIMRDEMLILLGGVSHVAARIFYIIARKESIFLVGAVISGVGPLAAPSIKSLVSKITPSYERAKLFTYVSMIDSSVPLLSSLLYLRTYKLLSDNFLQDLHKRAYVFVLTIVTQVACIICIVAFIRRRRNLSISLNDNVAVSIIESNDEENEPPSTMSSICPTMTTPTTLTTNRLSLRETTV